MVPLDKMQTNYSEPCHKRDGGNTLATRYNHKKILIDDTYWFFYTSFILGDVMNCVYIVKVEAIHGPLFVFKNYGSSGENANKLFSTLPQRKWGLYFSNKIQS
jgi:hypothetical protein